MWGKLQLQKVIEFAFRATDPLLRLQMAMMAAILQSDQRINDVVAYVNTLSGTKEQLEVAGRE